jgi:hypothetical protein
MLRDAWREATSTLKSAAPRLFLTACSTCDLTCEQRPTVQAFEHLFVEALGRCPTDGAVTVTGTRHGGRRSLEILAELGPDPIATDLRASLRIILARLLLEMQGATVICTTSSETWMARIEFPGRG